jgi:hypothetical protein
MAVPKQPSQVQDLSVGVLVMSPPLALKATTVRRNNVVLSWAEPKPLVIPA